jgi:hypothetical protein
MEMFAGPKPRPLITKIEPWASGEKKPRLLAPFATLVMTGDDWPLRDIAAAARSIITDELDILLNIHAATPLQM